MSEWERERERERARERERERERERRNLHPGAVVCASCSDADSAGCGGCEGAVPGHAVKVAVARPGAAVPRGGGKGAAPRRPHNTVRHQT